MVIANNIKMRKPVLKVSRDSDSDEDSLSAEESDNEDKYSNEEKKKVDKNHINFENNSSEDDHEADAESDDHSSDSDNNDNVLMTNEGWADSIAKILGSNKPKNKKTLVLSRAKKHSTVKVEKEDKPEFEVTGDEKKEKLLDRKEESVILEPPIKKIKQTKVSLRIKPNVLEKDRERLLSKIATKGVVQLFNAVRNQQKSLQKEMDRNDLSEGKKEKILKKFDKRAFLDTLMGQSKSITVDEEVATKNEVKAEDTPKWSALRDDFMMGAKMKDWDKESVDE